LRLFTWLASISPAVYLVRHASSDAPCESLPRCQEA
jgi:hypothetical protein